MTVDGAVGERSNQGAVFRSGKMLKNHYSIPIDYQLLLTIREGKHLAHQPFPADDSNTVNTPETPLS